MQDFKDGDKVVVVDALGNESSYVGQELTIKSYAASYGCASILLLEFEEVEWRIFSERVEKLEPVRHVHADLIIKKANDVTVVIQKLSGVDGHWYTTSYPSWEKDSKYREKPPKPQGQIKIEELQRNMTALKAQYDYDIEKLQEEVYLLNEIENNKEF